MSAPAPRADDGQPSSAAGWPLRLTQRAFAALLELALHGGGTAGAFRAARLRGAARRTLSALSADDHARLVRWLALQLATAARETDAAAALARADAATAAGVAALLARTREELGAGGTGGAAAA